jgi:hypothetical protein
LRFVFVQPWELGNKSKRVGKGCDYGGISTCTNRATTKMTVGAACLEMNADVLFKDGALVGSIAAVEMAL